MIPVDSIEIPHEFYDVCTRWYDGVGDMLYAICSTGGLMLGNRRPLGCDTDEKWYYSLWCDLSADVGRARRAAEKGYNAHHESDGGDGYGHDADYPVLVDFEEWADAQVEALAVSYGLEDWDGEEG
jgi:hypothetical protein